MSHGANQKTLFQTWGASVPENKVSQPKKTNKKAVKGRPRKPCTISAGPAKAQHQTGPDDITLPQRTHSLWGEVGRGSAAEDATHEDDDDDLMLVAVYEAEKTLQLEPKFPQDDSPPGAESSALPSSVGRCYPDFPGFDSSSAKVWIYPTNYPIREYQLKISEAALLQNTLVCLPTGLGKTFIAAVVMYNFYRWYPSGKIVFMAPTKPLVAQQIEACYKIMGIPQTHMAELTGGMFLFTYNNFPLYFTCH